MATGIITLAPSLSPCCPDSLHSLQRPTTLSTLHATIHRLRTHTHKLRHEATWHMEGGWLKLPAQHTCNNRHCRRAQMTTFYQLFTNSLPVSLHCVSMVNYSLNYMIKVGEKQFTIQGRVSLPHHCFRVFH